MFKLVVLSALFAFAAAKPSLHGAYLAPLHTTYVAPSAVSHQSRVDVHGHALVAPAVAAIAPVHTAVAAPLAISHHAPTVYLGHGGYNHLGLHHYLHKRSLLAAPLAVAVAPAAVSHQSRVDVHSTPLVHAYAAPVYSHHAYAAPILSHYAAPYHGLLGHRAYGVHAW